MRAGAFFTSNHRLRKGFRRPAAPSMSTWPVANKTTCLQFCLYALFLAQFALSRAPITIKSRPMFQSTEPFKSNSEISDARDWVKILSNYREPSTWRSVYELAVTLGPFIVLWALAWWSLSISGWLTLTIALFNAGFILRLFAIQHDCGHSASGTRSFSSMSLIR